MNEDVCPIGNGDFPENHISFQGCTTNESSKPVSTSSHDIGQAQEGTAQEVWEAQQHWQKGVWMSIIEGFLTKNLLYPSQDITMKISY